jgi:hypothetical protein
VVVLDVVVPGFETTDADVNIGRPGQRAGDQLEDATVFALIDVVRVVA